MSLGLNPGMGQWISGIQRKDLPFFETPESFLNNHPAWNIAHQQFFDINPHLDNEKNRYMLIVHMIKCYQENPNSLPTHVAQDMRNVLEDNAEEIKPLSTSLALLKAIGEIFLNIITLGLYGIIVSSLQNRKISQYEDRVRNLKEYAEDAVSRLRNLGDYFQNKHQLAEGKRAALQNVKNQIEILKKDIQFIGTDGQDVKARIIEARQALKSAEETLAEMIEECARDEVVEDMTCNTPEGGKGWAQPAYTIKDTDPLFIKGSQANALDNCTSMEDLLIGMFGHVMKTMEDEARKNKISFNRSSKIIKETEVISGKQQSKHMDKIHSIYSVMAFMLVFRAELKRTNADDARLILNKKGLTVACSQPFWSKNDQVFFKHHDEWTPSYDYGPNGVDPISAKFLFQQLQGTGDLEKVITILCDPWTPSTNQELMAAKALRDGTGKTSQVLQKVLPLINDIASALQENFEANLEHLWKDYFNDDSAVLLDKTYTTVETNLDDELKKIMSWDPQNLPIALDYPELVQDLECTRQLLSPIWKDIRNVLEKPLADNSTLAATPNLENTISRGNFWYFHLGIDRHGCLFSSLATSLLQGASKKADIHPKRLKEFLAGWLEGGAGENEAIATIISAETRGWSWIDYAKFLRAHRDVPGRENAMMGDLELELLCRAFEVHIELFTDHKGRGQHTIKDGIMTPSRQYGAINAKEKITLYNVNGSSFYALFPKVRQPKSTDSPELKKALTHAHTYWETNNGIEYLKWHRFVFNDR